MSGWERDQYAPMVRRIMAEGERRETRNGFTRSTFCETLTVDAAEGFPLLRGRKMFYGPVLGELAAMLRGPKHVDDFKRFGCNYWDAWGSKGNPDYEPRPGSLELDYGNAWIDFNGVNQLEAVIDKLKNNPTDRRILISGWRPDRLGELSLPCCHLLYQWYVRGGTHLDMIWYQRSADVMVGVPSDVILAAAWNAVLARECGYVPGRVTLVFGDTHVYENHFEKAERYLDQLGSLTSLQQAPIVYRVGEGATCAAFVPEDVHVAGYLPQPAIKFELNV